MHVADQVADRGHAVRAERQLAGGRRLQAHLVFQPGGENPVARPKFQRVGIEEVLGHVEQAQTLGAGPRALGSGQHEVKDVLGGIADIAAGDEPLDALDVPCAVGLCDRLAATRADVGARIGLGQHHGGRPAALQAHCRPPLLLLGALHGQRIGHRRSQAPRRIAADGLAHSSISLIAHVSGARRGHAADLLGYPDAPPFGVLDRLHRFRQLRGHA